MVLGRNVLLILCFGLGCATPKHAQDLPTAGESPDAGEEEGVSSEMPKQGDAELASGFDPEKEQPKEAPKAVAAEVKPAAGAEEEAHARRTFDEQLSLAKKAIAAGNAEDGRDAAKLATEAAEALFPADQQKAAEVQFQLERAGTDTAAAWKAGVAWLDTCGPDKVDGCRAKVVATLNAAAKKKEFSSFKAGVREITDADTCLKKLEATRQAAVCEAAHGVYHRQKDKLMTARLLLARALAVSSDPKKKDEAVALLGRADAECGELRCVSVRRRALLERRRIALRDQDLAEAAKDVLTEVKLASSLLPRAQRTYARTSEVDKICAQLDAKDGAGSCRHLEKRINGEYSFRDFSAGKTLPGLGQDKVKEVNDHYACLLQDCLAQQAERMRPPDMEEYEVRWMVLNDGRVGDVHLKRKTDEESPLGQCLRDQFAVWRYPKYQGEFQHVEQRFTVSALKRR